ncbi:Uncharacterised protein [Bordetella pertussis]|nr:Uncharacterised protein [Bordetella pertussis]
MATNTVGSSTASAASTGTPCMAWRSACASGRSSSQQRAAATA